MTDKELMQMALDALESSRVFVTTREKIKHPEGTEWYDERIEALRAALAQQDESDITYEVWQYDEWQAGSNSKEETMRYAMQYADDGTVEVHEVTRRVICKIEK